MGPSVSPMRRSELPGEEGKSRRQRSTSGLGKSLLTADALGKVPFTRVAGVRTRERLGRSKDGAESSD